MPTYLVTGGAGFIGSNIVHELVSRGETVRVLDDFSTGRRVNLENVLAHIELVEGSLLDQEICHQAVQDVDYVLHQAAVPSVQRSIADPLRSHHANTTGTLNLLNAARQSGVRRLVHASSSSIYGDTPVMPKQEDMPPRPKSPYAVSKFSAEQYCQVFAQIYEIETVSLRYFNVFGPRQNPNSQYSAVIPKFIKLMLTGKPPVIYGDGQQSRDFTFVDNNVEANILAATAPHVSGQVFNIACGARFTLIELIDALNHILGTNIQPIFNPSRQGDVKHSLADIRRAQECLNYKVITSFEEGLAKTVAWYQESHDE